MKRILLTMLSIALVFCTVFNMTGCSGKSEVPEGSINIYYINKEATQVVSSVFTPECDNSDIYGKLDEIIAVMSGEIQEINYVPPIPEGVEIDSYVIRDDILVLYFNENYVNMDPVTEILCRLAMVSTFCQLDGISGIELYVGGAPMMDSRGDEVGVLKPDSFVENPGEQINSINRASITLYFANEDTQTLVREYRTVYYNSNIALEKIVIEHLLAGPRTEGLLSTIPLGTKLTSITTVDGICYVSFDSGFQNQNYEIPEEIVIYSIVNSLTALSFIDKVQISVNGDTTGVYRDSFELSKLYEANSDVVSTQIRSNVIVESSDGLEIEVNE